MKVKSRVQTTIALAFSTIVFGTALVMAVLSYNFTEEAVRRTSRDYTSQLIGQVQASIDTYITHMEYIAEVVHLNEQVLAYFGEALGEETSDATERSRITSFLDSISRTRDDISLILLVGTDGRIITHDENIRINRTVDIPSQDWYRRALRSSGWTVVSSSHVQNIVEGEYPWVITLSRTINDPGSGEVRGVLLVDLNFSVINELLGRVSFGRRGYLFIVDADGRIVYHPRQELIYSEIEREYIDLVLDSTYGSFLIDDERGARVYTVRTSSKTRWRTVGVDFVSELVRNRETIRRYYAWWSLICLAVAILVSVLISHRISMPIMRLRASVLAVEQGNFDIQVDVGSSNEIGDLARDFSIMVAQIKELMRRNREEQELKRKSELMALQNQITPHFLYNTLDSVIWMAEAKQHENVVTTVSALARLLRLSVSRGDELITIHDEIEHISSYLTIQKLRYRDKLDFSIEVDETILDLRIPKVILQPLVENAIYHGIKNKEGVGSVRVTGNLDGDDVILSVHDDGVGMSEERMAGLLVPIGSREIAADQPPPGPVRQPGTAGRGGGLRSRRASRGTDQRHSRVGVMNVHERIRLYFGDGYGLNYRSENGTTVDIRLPIVRSERGIDDV